MPKAAKKHPSIYNEDIASMFEQLADLLEIDNANPFRVRAYRNAARMLKGRKGEISKLLEDGEDISALPTIGKDLAAKIGEIVQTGRLAMLENIKRSMPAALAELTRIHGLGPKRVKLIHDELNIETAAQLRKAALEGRISALSGIGAKTENEITRHFSRDRSQDGRVLLADAQKIADRLVEYLAIATFQKSIEVAGSLRRRQETVGDLDILVASNTPAKVINHFIGFDEIDIVEAKGNTKATVKLHSGVQVDLRAVKTESYGAALVYLTGSKGHNIELRKRAVKRGLKINEYGVFKGKRLIGGGTEHEVYAAVDLTFIPPELREERGEFIAAQTNMLPTLIDAPDICGDLHVHTKASDGLNTIKEIALKAKRIGYKYLAITDHSKHATVAHGLDEKRFEKQLAEIDRVNDSLTGIRILKSAEVDILADGSLDLADEILSKLDLVVGAVHFDFTRSAEKQTERIVRAMDHPAFSILAHPTCRLIGERDPMRINMEKLMDAASERGCFLELNGQPQRLDLNDINCRMAKDRKLKIALSTDAHSVDQLDYMRFCIGQARRGWIEKSDVINTRSWRDLKKLLKR